MTSAMNGNGATSPATISRAADELVLEGGSVIVTIGASRKAVF
jgi:hypothetical protein